MTLLEECMYAIEQTGWVVMDDTAEVIGFLKPDDTDLWLTRWMFQLLCMRVHYDTPHRCLVTTQ